MRQLGSVREGHRENREREGTTQSTKAREPRSQQTSMARGRQSGNWEGSQISNATRARAAARIRRVCLWVFMMLVFEAVRPLLELRPEFDIFFDKCFVPLQAKLGGLLCKVPVSAFLG